MIVKVQILISIINLCSNRETTFNSFILSEIIDSLPPPTPFPIRKLLNCYLFKCMQIINIILF